AAALFCRRCGQAVRRDSAESIYAELGARAARAGDPRLLLTFPVPVPENFTPEEVRELLARQGYTRFCDVPAATAASARAAPAARARRGKRTRAGKARPSLT